MRIRLGKLVLHPKNPIKIVGKLLLRKEMGDIDRKKYKTVDDWFDDVFERSDDGAIKSIHIHLGWRSYSLIVAGFAGLALSSFGSIVNSVFNLIIWITISKYLIGELRK